MIRTVIVEDEEKGMLALKELIKRNCPDLEVVGTADSVASGLKTILKHEPELIFLDINMPDGDGFEILELIKKRDFEVIFTTAYHHYATKAFEFAALHYLLKPIGADDLIEAMQRFRNTAQKNRFSEEHYDILKDGLDEKYDKLAIPIHDGVCFVRIRDIVRCEAEQSYTIFYFADHSKVITSKNMGKYEKLLAEFNFFRIHDKHMVNLHHVKKYLKGPGGDVLMEDGVMLPVSVRKKNQFLEAIDHFTRKI